MPLRAPTTKPCSNDSRMNAKIGDISNIPPIGGIIPLNMFKNGSVIERINLNGCCSHSIDGIQLKNTLMINKI